MILSEISKEGQNIRDSYQRRLPSDPSKDYYFMQRNTGNTQTLTVEYGFLDSTGDDVSQLKNNYKDYAEAVVRAVTSYINADYVPIAGTNTYIVKSGDSLYSIARKYGITVDELKQYNNLTSNLLSIGQILKIPTEESESEEAITYIVKSGDSLYSIARTYNVSVDDIKNYNNLSSNILSIGQQLLIPQTIINEVIEYETYTVKSGDSLYSIAKKYNTSVDEIKTLNNLTSNLLSVGQKLLIPIEEVVEEIIPNYIEYTVQRGDTLYGIANKYNLTVDEIKSYNNLQTNALSIGQILKIPSSSDEIIYVVQSGDSLYSIAKKYNTTVDSIKIKNNLTSNLLSIGQELII